MPPHLVLLKGGSKEDVAEMVMSFRAVKSVVATVTSFRILQVSGSCG
jgi:hypothetical protein